MYLKIIFEKSGIKLENCIHKRRIVNTQNTYWKYKRKHVQKQNLTIENNANTLIEINKHWPLTKLYLCNYMHL